MQKNIQKNKFAKTKTLSEKNLFEISLIEDYSIHRLVGKGSFGVIYEVSKISMSQSIPKKGKETFALKLEKSSNNDHNSKSQLYKEVTILKELKNLKGFADLFDYGIFKGSPYMVTTLLGNNLSKVLEKNNGNFDQDATMQIAYQMIDRLQVFHDKGYLHRDLKPENFVLGLNENSTTLYLIDFGLSKKYIEKQKHIPMAINKGFVGTARYASPNAHRGYEQGRRDDLISIGFLLMYFLKGKLPWQGMLVDRDDKKYEAIGKIKEETDFKSFFKGYDHSFLDYMTYVNGLRFEDTPNYIYLKEIFRKAFEKISKEKKQENVLEKPKKTVKDISQAPTEYNENELKEPLGKFLDELDDKNNEKKKIVSGIMPKYPMKKNKEMISKSSTLNPNYDDSSCNIYEDEDAQINFIHTYEFFNCKDKIATKGFFLKYIQNDLYLFRSPFQKSVEREY